MPVAGLDVGILDVSFVPGRAMRSRSGNSRSRHALRTSGICGCACVREPSEYFSAPHAVSSVLPEISRGEEVRKRCHAAEADGSTTCRDCLIAIASATARTDEIRQRSLGDVVHGPKLSSPALKAAAAVAQPFRTG